MPGGSIVWTQSRGERGELREHQQGARNQQGEVPLGGERRTPAGEQRRVRDHFLHAASEDEEIEHEVGHGGSRRQADRLVKPFKKTAASTVRIARVTRIWCSPSTGWRDRKSVV